MGSGDYVDGEEDEYDDSSDISCSSGENTTMEQRICVGIMSNIAQDEQDWRQRGNEDGMNVDENEEG